MYVHMCDDGTLMLDETIRRCGVGQYFAGWEKIEAEWYMAITPGLEKIELKSADGTHQGFAIAQKEGTNEARYPHVYGIRPGSALTLSARGEGMIEVLADGAPLGMMPIASADFAEATLPLGDLAGEHDLTLRLTGRLTLDWLHIGA